MVLSQVTGNRPFDPIRPKLFDQKGRPNSSTYFIRPISFDPFHAIPTQPARFESREGLIVFGRNEILFCLTPHRFVNRI